MASSFNVPPWAEQTVIVVVNIFVSFAAGCATEARKFAAVYKFAPLLPMISQFVLQPLLVSGLGRAFNLNPYVLVGMLLCATTPGGNGSNIAEVRPPRAPRRARWRGDPYPTRGAEEEVRSAGSAEALGLAPTATIAASPPTREATPRARGLFPPVQAAP